MVLKNNHEKMIVWQMADTLDIEIQNLLKKLPKNEFSMKSQIDSASDSIGSNFVEGYYAGSLGEYIRFLRYSRRSCAELQERVRRISRKGYLDNDYLNSVLDKIIKTGYLIDRLVYSLETKKVKEGGRRLGRRQ